MIHIVNEAEVDVFLELPCFLYGPMNVANLISGSSVFSKSSLYIWKFSVHILLKPSLRDFEFIFVCGIRECYNFILFTHIYLVFPALLIEEIIFSPLSKALALSVKQK